MLGATHKENRGRRLRRGRLFLLVALVAVGVQVPLILLLGRLTGYLGLVIALAALLSAGFFGSFVGPRTVWSAPSRRRLYLLLWPFFYWWTVALLCTLLAPVALLARILFGAPEDLNTALVVWLAAAAVGAAFTLWQRPRIRRFDVEVDGLPEAFDGYRVAQISDLHCGPFASGPRVARWVKTVNAQQPDLIAVTGDLIASGSSFVTVVAGALGGLRARDGAFASMGNHDYFGDGELMVRSLEKAGLTVLRNRGVDIVRGDSAIHVAGVDDTWTRRADLDRALSARRPGIPTVLLAHDPDLFVEAVEKGVDLTLSGHTHGGQVGVPLFARKLNLARLTTAFSTGFFRVGAATLYVNNGLGTTGPPVRLGVPPEIAVITLRCSVPAANGVKRRRRPAPGRQTAGAAAAARG